MGSDLREMMAGLPFNPILSVDSTAPAVGLGSPLSKGACLCDRLWNTCSGQVAGDPKIPRPSLTSGFGVLLVSVFVSLYGAGHSITQPTPNPELAPSPPSQLAEQLFRVKGEAAGSSAILVRLWIWGELGYFLIPVRNISSFITRWSK